MAEAKKKIVEEGRTRLVGASELMKFVQDVLVKAGVPSSDAHIVADCLLTANLSGIDSHGVIRLAHYIRRLETGTINPRPALKLERTALASGIITKPLPGIALTQQPNRWPAKWRVPLSLYRS